MKYLICSFILLSNLVSAQNSIELVQWTDEPCDSDYDPHLLVNRISSITEDQGVTSVTINFHDNCCPQFDPSVELKGDTVFFYIWKENKGSCSCTCCFSMRYDLKDFDTNKNYVYYFQDAKVKESDDPYPVKEPVSELYNGMEINRENKYGFKEGLWITFYDDGRIKSESTYPEHNMQSRSFPIESKSFYENGQLAHHYRRDARENWFEDGELWSYEYRYEKGDTSFIEEMSKFSNKNLREHSLEREYKVIIDNKVIAGLRDTGRISETVYIKEYYENGQKKHDFHINKDTSYLWYKTGELERLEYRNGSKNFSKNGMLQNQSFNWQENDSQTKSRLVIWYRTNSTKLLQVKLLKTESFLSPKEYIWDFDLDGKLNKSPSDWEGPYPWKRFPELNWIKQ